MIKAYVCAVAKNIPNDKIFAPMLDDGSTVLVISQAFILFTFTVDNSITPELVPLLFERKITYEVAIGLDATTGMGLDLDGDIIWISDGKEDTDESLSVRYLQKIVSVQQCT